MGWQETGTRSITLKREELHRLVWSVPGSRLAIQLGISDVGLSKVCRRYLIPRPPRGYWARLAAGQKPRKVPLPKAPSREYETVYLKGWNMPEETAARMLAEGSRTPAKAATPFGPPHPLVESAGQQLAQAEPDAAGLVRTNPMTAPSIRVSPITVTRALGVLDMLIKRWEARGGYVRPEITPTGSTFGTAIGIGGDAFFLNVVETIDDRKPLTDPSRRTGYVGFYINGDESRQFRRRWAETKTQKLERMIEPLLETLANALEVMKTERIDKECEARQEKAVKSLRATRAQNHSRAFYNRQDLVQEANRWGEATRVRAYLSAIQEAVTEGKIWYGNEAAYNEWLEWAHAYADSIDPLVGAAHPHENTKPPENTPIEQLDITDSLRKVLNQLGLRDTDDLWKVSEEQVRKACEGKFGRTWNEITRVLEALRYDVAKRQEAYAWA